MVEIKMQALLAPKKKITSLREKSIFRIKLNNVKPIMIEKIELGFRIRDLVQEKNSIFIQEAGSKYIWELKESS